MSTQSPQVAAVSRWFWRTAEKSPIFVDDLPIEVANGWGQTWMVDIGWFFFSGQSSQCQNGTLR